MEKVILSGSEACLVRHLCCQYVKRLQMQLKEFPFCKDMEVDLINYSQLLNKKFGVKSLTQNKKNKQNEQKCTYLN